MRTLFSILFCIGLTASAATIPPAFNVPFLNAALPVASAGPYSPSQVEFDGSNERLQFSSSAVTMAAGKQLTISFWVNTAVDGATQFILQGRSGTSGPQWNVRLTTLEQVRFVATDASSNIDLDASSGNDTVEAGDGWVHVLFSVDMTGGASTRHLYINNVSSAAWAVFNDDTLAFDRTNLNIGADDGLGSDYTGCLAEIWVDDSYIDFSVEANRQKFALAGLPVDLGADGSTPTGTAPDLYMRFISGSLGVNSGGDGGTASASGTPADGTCGTISY